MANHWTTPATGSPAYMAMQMYRNYDGHDSDIWPDQRFGHGAESGSSVVVRRALRSDGALTVMVINKNLYSSSSPTTSITLNLSGFDPGGAAQVYQLAATNPTNQEVAAISHLANVNFSSNSMTFNAPGRKRDDLRHSGGDNDHASNVDANPAAFAYPIIFTATVGAGSVTPTGAVSFMDGTTCSARRISARASRLTLHRLWPSDRTILRLFTGGRRGFTGSTSAVLQEIVAAPPTVSSVQMNGGAVERSELRSIAVTFSDAVTFAGGDAEAALRVDSRAGRH